MLKHKKVIFKVKSGSSWIVLPDSQIAYWIGYKNNFDFYLKEPNYVEVRDIQIPVWAGYLKDQIKTYLENNPKTLESTYDGREIEIL